MGVSVSVSRWPPLRLPISTWAFQGWFQEICPGCTQKRHFGVFWSQNCFQNAQIPLFSHSWRTRTEGVIGVSMGSLIVSKDVCQWRRSCDAKDVIFWASVYGRFPAPYTASSSPSFWKNQITKHSSWIIQFCAPSSCRMAVAKEYKTELQLAPCFLQSNYHIYNYTDATQLVGDNPD